MNITILRMSHQVFNDSTLEGAKADKLLKSAVCPLSFSPYFIEVEHLEPYLSNLCKTYNDLEIVGKAYGLCVFLGSM